MSATEDQAIADLLFRLRTAPETLGPLRGTTDRFDRKARSERKAALEAVWPLREAVIAARWAKIAEAVNAPATQVTWSFVKGFAPSPQRLSVHADDFAAAVTEPDIEEETNQLEIGHEQLTAAVDEIATVLASGAQTPGTGNIDKTRAIDAAVRRLKSSTAAAMLEDDQLPEAVVANDGTATALPPHSPDETQETLE